MENEDGKRLKEWRIFSGLSQKELGSMIGRSQGYIGDIEAGRAGISRDLLARLLKNTNVNSDYLLTGEGPLSVEKQDKGFQGRASSTRIAPIDQTRPFVGDFAVGHENFSLVRRFEVNVSAGPGLFPVDESVQDALAIPDAWMRKNGLNSDLCGLIRVSGDSMAPTIPDGALALVHLPEMIPECEGIYAFSRDGQAYIKRLSPIHLKDSRQLAALLITSDNPAYPPETVSGDALNNIRVVGRIRMCLFDL